MISSQDRRVVSLVSLFRRIGVNTFSDRMPLLLVGKAFATAVTANCTVFLVFASQYVFSLLSSQLEIKSSVRLQS